MLDAAGIVIIISYTFNDCVVNRNYLGFSCAAIVIVILTIVLSSAFTMEVMVSFYKMFTLLKFSFT